MRCPDCNKFVAFDEADPEVDSLEISEDGAVTVGIRIVNTCADCGTELKEAMFELEEEAAIPDGHLDEGHELMIQECGSERTQRSGYIKKGVFVPAGGRYAKTFYGASVDYEITCSCGEMEPVQGTLMDDVQASSMDEMV
jgi:hypothetical protein